MVNKTVDKLRIVMITGVLGKAGAEKQLFYIASSLNKNTVEIKVLSLTKGEYYEQKLKNMGIDVEWVGKRKFPLLRLFVILIYLIQYKPDLIYSTHFFSNLYAAVPGKMLKVVSIGSIRNDTFHELNQNGKWGKLLFRWPTVLIVNSFQAVENAVLIGEKIERLFVLPNYINLSEFDKFSAQSQQKLEKKGKISLVLIARLVKAKRIDRFIQLISELRGQNKAVVGWIVGSGPEREQLKTQADEAGLNEDELVFLGQREDIPSILQQSDIFILTSDHEGFPNVLLEAMAASLPMVTTPAGDSGKIVVNGSNGFVVKGSEINEFVDNVNLLIESVSMRKNMGVAGRKMVEKQFDMHILDSKLTEIFFEIALYSKQKKLITKITQINERILLRKKYVQPE